MSIPGVTGVINRVVSGFAGFLAYTFPDMPVYIPDSLTKAVYDKDYGYKFEVNEKWGINASYMDTKCILMQLDGIAGNQDDNTQPGFGEWVDDVTGEARAGSFMRYSTTITVSMKFRFASKNDGFEFLERLLTYAETDLMWSVLVNGIEVPARANINESFSFSTNDDNKFYIELSTEIETQVPVFSTKTQDASKLIMNTHWQGFTTMGDLVNTTTDESIEDKTIIERLDVASYNRNDKMNEWLRRPRDKR